MFDSHRIIAMNHLIIFMSFKYFIFIENFHLELNDAFDQFELKL